MLRLSHGKVNAFDSELLGHLLERLDELERSAVRSLVITGNGSVFSAGVDLWRVLDGGADYLTQFVPLLARALERLFVFPRPVVAALNGHAIAGGCVLACACDYRIMAAGAGRIGVPELRVGVPFPAVALEILRSIAPSSLLRRLVFLGAMYEAGEAAERGLVDEAAPPESLLDRACEAAEGLAVIPADTFRVTKEQLRRPVLQRVAETAAAVDAEVTRIWASDEVMAAIRSHMERTVRGRARPSGPADER